MYAVDVRGGKLRRHRNRRKQLEVQKERVDREVKERREEGEELGDEVEVEGEEAVGGKRKCSRTELQRRKAAMGDNTLLPYMPLLNSK
jgi:F0F1-type ATP synthase membrane subunit b/b'